MEKTALVTGSSGYLGSQLSKDLHRAGFTVVGFDQKIPTHKYNHVFYPGDIRDRTRVNEVLARHKYDLVIHCASRIEVGESMKDPTEFHEVNVGGTAILLNAMKKNKVPKILFSSTAAVYLAGYMPLQEDECTTPDNSVYGSTKIACENMIMESGIKYGIFRYFNLAGADPEGDIGENHEPETHLIPSIFRNLNTFRVYGNDYDTDDGTCVRDYVHVSDVSSAHLLAIDHLDDNDSFIVNLGTGTGYSILQIIKLIESTQNIKVNYSIAERRMGDPDRLVADVTLAKNLLNYRPKHDILSIIATAYEWEKRNGRE